MQLVLKPILLGFLKWSPCFHCKSSYKMFRESLTTSYDN